MNSAGRGVIKIGLSVFILLLPEYYFNCDKYLVKTNLLAETVDRCTEPNMRRWKWNIN